MTNVHLVGGLDIAELTFFAFFLFFLGLVWYLRGEDRREGYPVEDDLTGAAHGGNEPLFFKPPKTFKLPHGLGEVTTPTANERDELPTNVLPRAWPGEPLDVVGDKLTSGVGPASIAQRADRPDLDMHGQPRIVPTRVISHPVSVHQNDVDPRGLPVFGLDGGKAGTVKDLWMDRAESCLRYLEVDLEGGAGTILMPITMAEVSRGGVMTDAITGAQIAGVPRTKSPDQVTLLEEEKITAYFGAGYLWATPERAEPLI
ncbi:photosynthetic reaction center subunit H [Sandarakinorhabdus oryzae]|uniref:photosynthetic reaction center subunit H n=1 Tax=Sandarakinorhabdus oryzae TaxID=2675220 RepID=UPI0012E1EA42|nr:photosynthetic reaction center subunit H [Sandarakinorhabdus oryzae]